MVKKSLAWVSGVLLVISLIGSIATAWLLKTESGLQWAIAQAGSSLSVQQVSGNATSMRLQNVRWSNPTTEIVADEVRLNWHAFELLNRRIRIDKLHLDNLRITTFPVEQSETGKPWSGTPLPVDVFLADGIVNQFSLFNGERPLLAINKLDLAAGVENNLLRIRRFNVTASQGQASITGKIDLAARKQGVVSLKNKINWQLEQTKLSAQGSFDGSWGNLQLQQEIKDTRGGTLVLSGSVADPLLLQSLSSDQGQAQSVLGLQGDWRLPFSPNQLGLAGGQIVNRGSFSLDGTPTAYTYSLESETAQDQLPMITAVMNGNGDLSGLTVSTMRIGEGESIAQGNGDFQWAPALKWNADLQLEDFSPSKFYPSLRNAPSSLDGYLTTAGERDAAASNPLGLLGEIKLSSMQGVFNDQALRFDLDIQMTSAEILIRSLEGSLGSATFSADGALSDQVRANWLLKVPDLGVFDASLAGVAEASGNISGPRETPRFSADLSTNTASYTLDGKSWQFDSASLIAQATANDLSAPLKIDVSFKNIAQNGSILVPEFASTVRGTFKQHQLALNAQFTKQTEASLVLDGGFTSAEFKQWSGQLSSLNALDVNRLSWQLEQPAKLSVSERSQELGETCVSAQAQRICVAAQQRKIQDQVEQDIRLTSKDFSLAAFEPLLVLYDIKPAGKLNGQLLVQQSATEQTPSAIARFHSDDFRLRVPLRADEDADASDNPRRYEWLEFNELTLEAEQGEEVDLVFALTRESGDEIRGNVHLNTSLPSADLQTAPLTAQISARLNNLAILPPQLLADLELNGSLAANIQVNGSIAEPRVAIRSELAGASLFIPAAGLDLADINMIAESTSESAMSLQGSLKSGEGRLNIEGNLAYPNINNPSAELRLAGENLDFVQTGDVDAVGSVDIVTKLANQTINVEGNVLLEKAHLALGARENVVTASNDVVIEGQEKKQAAIKQSLKLTVDLGEDTHLQAAGLDARLVGKLAIRQSPGELMTGRGKIEIKDGVYRAYGEKLDISRGKLIFSGTSIDDPSLELNATKTVNDIEAGVRVRGRAQAPEVSLFSTPSMTDQDILSVLIFGKPVSDLASQDSLTLLRIAASLRGDGPDRFTRMTSQLQDALGLTNLELRLTGDAPEVVAGKQLSSRFYIGYGYGLLDAVQSIVLRYKISEAWSIQGDFGADSGADLRYQLER